MPDVVRRFRQARPAVEIREGWQSEVIDDVRSGLADAGVSYVDALFHNLAAEALVREPYLRDDPERASPGPPQTAAPRGPA